MHPAHADVDSHNTTLQKNYQVCRIEYCLELLGSKHHVMYNQAMLHCGAIRQTVRILGIDHPQGILRTGDRAVVEFEFISNPEFIKEGMKLLFREGKTKVSVPGLERVECLMLVVLEGLGVVTKLVRD